MNTRYLNIAVRDMVLSALVLAFFFGAALTARAETSILNVSYDISRELYKDINTGFSAARAASGGKAVTVRQSHGGSSRQALSVIAGLEADVVTMNQAPDIDILVERGSLVAKDWRTRFPHEASPYATVSVFLVRKGNPKGIRDWSDLVKPGMQVIVPNPKTSGNGRYTYLAAWGYAISRDADEAKARNFVEQLFAKVPVLDGGGRGATTTFAQRDIGDVLVTFEAEATAVGQEFGADKFEVVYPSLTIEAAAPVAVVETVVAKRGAADIARAYLQFLFSPEGQRIIARHHFRPRDQTVLAETASRFPVVKTFTVESLLGGWAKVQSQHFADGALYDQISVKRR